MPDLYLFDDGVSCAWEPFALTRPGGELRFGAMTFRERAERVFDGKVAAHLVADHLVGFEEPGAAPVLPFVRIPKEGDRLFLSARAVPAWGSGETWRERRGGAGPVLVDEQVVGWYAPDGTPSPDAEWFADPARHLERTGAVQLPGRVLGKVWELMSEGFGQVTLDVAGLFPTPPAHALPHGVHWFGEHPIIQGQGVRIEPAVVIDTTGGPVWFDDGATVRAFTRIAGPAYVGKNTQILGGSLEAFSTGETCRLRGEFAESICLSFVNKAHDGHIGHAYLGSWVNLGAFTTNSDLKNNYGPVRLWTPDGEADTGEIKMGCFLGDHVKTGIGLLLNTGTVVGAGSNLFGAEMPPKYVPPFSWGTGEDLSAYRADKFLEVAERAMARRKVPLAPGARAQLEAAWKKGRPQG